MLVRYKVPKGNKIRVLNFKISLIQEGRNNVVLFSIELFQVILSDSML